MTDLPRPPTCVCQGPIPSTASRASLGLPARSLFAVSRSSELVRPRASVWPERLPSGSEGASRRQLSARAKSIISKVALCCASCLKDLYVCRSQEAAARSLEAPRECVVRCDLQGRPQCSVLQGATGMGRHRCMHSVHNRTWIGSDRTGRCGRLRVRVRQRSHFARNSGQRTSGQCSPVGRWRGVAGIRRWQRMGSRLPTVWTALQRFAKRRQPGRGSGRKPATCSR